MDLVGTIDEVSSFLGASRALIKSRVLTGFIKTVQGDLFCVAAEAATTADFLSRLDKKIAGPQVARLEEMIACMESRGCRPRSFVSPGGAPVSGFLDIARSLVRRAERRAVTLSRRGKIKNPQVIVYLNRLSDLLYLLARACDGKAEA
jgi:cob(I)alamin adenosyltransferase